MTTRSTSRREFLLQAAGSTAVLTAACWSHVHGASEKLRVAAVGVGGKGWSDLTSVAASPKVEIVALCDVDESRRHLGQAAEKFPGAKRFTDWRKLFDEARTFDAVIVATPDHMHAPIALPAMQLGKHIYCEKPLTHSLFEARQMRLAAKKYRVVTQMGNQIQSHEAYRKAVKLLRKGAIGKVKEVHSWQSGRLGWMLVDDRPAGADPIPEKLHWDQWLGVAPARPYKDRIYHSFNWRAWQDFSNGQLGDFGCHILDPVFLGLKLTAPSSVRAIAATKNREVWARHATIHYVFPGTEFTAGRTLNLTWYDGEGKLPPRGELGLALGERLPGAGSLLIGEKGYLIIPHVGMPLITSAGLGTALDLEKESSRDHYVGWADACRGVGSTTSSFDYAGPLTETVLLGSVAVRVPETTLQWDAAALKVVNSAAANALVRKAYRKGWEPAWIT
jgi:predicted dehydrogenase